MKRANGAIQVAFLAACMIVMFSGCGGGGGGAGPNSPGIDTTAPSVPTDMKAAAAGPTSIACGWTASTDSVGVAGYKVFRNAVEIEVISTTSYTDTGLSSGTTYTYTVAAFDSAGNMSAQSAPASATTLTTPDVAPPASPAITGVVKDLATGASLSGAVVSAGGTSATADGNGVYALTLAAGSYILTAAGQGHLTTTQITTVKTGATNTINWALTRSYGTQAIPAESMTYVILAWNDLGMHCDQDDYSYFCVLPPFNTLHAQVLHRGLGGTPVTAGITVSYAFPKKTDSTLHTNFWTFAPQFGFGNLPPNVGLTGNGMSGNMAVDSKNRGFVATGIPVTPYDDDGTWDPFGTAVITVKDPSGNVLQTANVVAPVSTEMMCSNCHGTANPQLDILTRHDAAVGTTFVADRNAGKVHLCAECHSSNALGAPGQPGVESLSLAMHNFHKDRMNATAASRNTVPECYNCHPGLKTQCLRGIMARAGKSCHDCHGDMFGMTEGMLAGRQPWLQEPRCGGCHASIYAENSNTLYRDSILQNSPDDEMNNRIYCEACHNGTHAEYAQATVATSGTVLNPGDTAIPQQFQGDTYWIHNCRVCHTDIGSGSVHTGIP